MKNEIFFGKNIKYLRKKRKLGQQQLANILDVPQSTLACWEKGIRTPKLEKVIDVANYFNVDLSIIYKDLSKEKEE